MKFTSAHPGLRLAIILLVGVLLTFIAADIALQPLRYDRVFNTGDSLTLASGETFVLEADDLIQEPGEIDKAPRLWRFYERQGKLHEALSAGRLQVAGEDLTGRRASIADLPPLFWVHVFVAFAGILISGWLWSLKSRDLAATFFAGSGAGLFISAIPAGVYTTRELALPATTFRVLEELNAIGASLFGISMIGLFLVFPRRLKWWRPLFIGLNIAFAFWTFLFAMKWTPDWANVNLITLSEMLVICAVIGAQFFATRRDPVARASLTWLGVSVLLGAGGFIALNSVPLVLKKTPLNQGYAFMFFVIIYLGLAAGLTRYRLFDVGQWAFRLLYYAIGAVLLILMDAALIYALGMERVSALGLSLLLIASLYLPLRDLIWRRIARRTNVEPDVLLADAMHVALAATAGERTDRWNAVLRKLFDPLELTVNTTPVTETQVTDDGLTLLVPPLAGSSSLKIAYPMGGRALFDRATLNLARQLVRLVQQAELDRQAYDRGVLEERRRVAQDLHDDVGARLLTGLNTSDEKTRSTLEGALADIRSIVSGMSGETVTWERLLADTRYECTQRLDSARLELRWTAEPSAFASRVVPEALRKLITSALRESVSNIVRHAQARKVQVTFEFRRESLHLQIEDDGRGLEPKPAGEREGFGLKSLERRVHAVGGSWSVSALNPGTRLEIRTPMPVE